LGYNRSKRNQIGERDNWVCGICGCDVDSELSIYESDQAASIDHIIPRSKGGSNKDENLQITHWDCNRIKGVSVAIAINKPELSEDEIAAAEYAIEMASRAVKRTRETYLRMNRK
jgi:hypothetical protein